jgi:hypothetical protein
MAATIAWFTALSSATRTARESRCNVLIVVVPPDTSAIGSSIVNENADP